MHDCLTPVTRHSSPVTRHPSPVFTFYLSLANVSDVNVSDVDVSELMTSIDNCDVRYKPPKPIHCDVALSVSKPILAPSTHNAYVITR